MSFKGGAKFKYHNIPIIGELNDLGYTSVNLHKLLSCSKGYSIDILRQPSKLTLGQIQAISWALNKPLGYVVNKLLCTPSKSGNWLDEDYSPEQHIEKIKKGN